MPIHKAFQKYIKACENTRWRVTDFRAGAAGRGKKDSDRFTAEIQYCTKMFTVTVIFDVEHPKFPPDIILNETADEIEFDHVTNMLPEKWTQNGDAALVSVLDQICDLYRAIHRKKFEGLQNHSVQMQYAVAQTISGLEVELFGAPQEAAFRIPLKLSDSTRRYLLDQFREEDCTDEFFVTLRWIVDSNSVFPSATRLIYPRLYEGLIRNIKVPSWNQDHIISDYVKSVNYTLSDLIKIHKKQTEQRRDLVEGLMRQLGGRSILKPEPMFRAHEHDDVKWSFVSFFFDCGKRKQAAIVRIEVPYNFPREVPHIICQSTEYLDKNNNPMTEDIGYYLNAGANILRVMKERIMYRVPMILKEMEERSEKLRMKKEKLIQQQKEGQPDMSPQKNNDKHAGSENIQAEGKEN